MTERELAAMIDLPGGAQFRVSIPDTVHAWMKVNGWLSRVPPLTASSSRF